MMLYLLVGLLAYVVASLWYIRKLHMRIRAYEQDWIVIEEITDHNQDGDIVIHCKHIEEKHHEDG